MGFKTFIAGLTVSLLLTTVLSAPVYKSSVEVGCWSLEMNDEFNDRIFLRTAASDQTTIWLHQGEAMTIVFNLDEAAEADVVNVRYSNDGESDDIKVTMDGYPVGSFKTVAHGGWGHLWNTFEDSGRIGTRRKLSAGRHVLSLHVASADKYGLEVDFIRLELHGEPGQDETKNASRFKCIHRTSERFGSRKRDSVPAK